MNIRYEYSPESFSGTEMDNAVAHLRGGHGASWQPTPENKLILNLPNTVEMSTPNRHADQIEYFCRHLKNRDSVIISLHPHNDRGTAIAATELGLLAGAERVEGTLFGNGERTGNADIMSVAMNMYSQGVDPELDFSNIHEIREIYEKCTKMKVHDRHPYAGELGVYSLLRFPSGCHQKGRRLHGASTIRSIGRFHICRSTRRTSARKYEPIIRINSQSGKGGAAFIMQQNFGYNLPKAMHPEFGAMVKAACDEAGRELQPKEIFDTVPRTNTWTSNIRTISSNTNSMKKTTRKARPWYTLRAISASAMRTIDQRGGKRPDRRILQGAARPWASRTTNSFPTMSTPSQTGADSKALSYIQLTAPDGRTVFGVGMDGNISLASIKGIICAINRACSEQKNPEGEAK